MNMDLDGNSKVDLLRVDGKVYCYTIQNGHLDVSVRTNGGEIVLNYQMDKLKDPFKLASDSTEALCCDARGKLYALNADGMYLLDLVNNTSQKLE